MILRSIIVDQPTKELIIYTDKDSSLWNQDLTKCVDEWFVLDR